MAIAGAMATLVPRMDKVLEGLNDHKRPDLQEVKTEFKKVQKVISENFESASPEVIKQAYEQLFKLTSKVWDVVTAIGERSYNESKRNSKLVDENKKLTEEARALIQDVEEQKKYFEDQKRKTKDLEGDENTLILGQMAVEIEKKIIAHVIPADIKEEFSIFNLISMEDVLASETRLCKKAFHGRYDEYCKSVTSWEKLQKDLQWDIRHDQFVLRVKQDRNLAAHRFHLQRAK